MECPACRRGNPEDAAFCGGCGAALRREVACAACGRRNPPGQGFCHGCGAPLSPVAASPAERAPRDYTPQHLAEKILRSRSAIASSRS